MSLARALTSATKRMRTNQDSSANQGSTSPNRSFSTRRNYGTHEQIDRNQISLPIELLSTTNPLAYDAPDLKNINIRDFQHLNSNTLPSPSTSSAASYLSDNDSAGLGSGLSSASSVTTPSISREASPTATEHKHDNYFTEPTFTVPVSPARSSTDNTSAIISPIAELPNEEYTLPAPEIPKRALSHTKKTHVELAHKRSNSRMRSPASSASLNNSFSNTGSDTPPRVRTSLDMLSPTTDGGVQHPFGPELAQVNELVEEINTPASECFSPTILAAPISFPNEFAKGPASPPRRAPAGRSESRTRGPQRFTSATAPTLAIASNKNAAKASKQADDVQVYNEDSEWLAERGLCKFGVEEYLAEIEGLYSARWEETVTGGWF